MVPKKYYLLRLIIFCAYNVAWKYLRYIHAIIREQSLYVTLHDFKYIYISLFWFRLRTLQVKSHCSQARELQKNNNDINVLTCNSNLYHDHTIYVSTNHIGGYRASSELYDFARCRRAHIQCNNLRNHAISVQCC